MIPIKVRESRRPKSFKLPKNLERYYKEGKCRECAVVVTRMDFAKILGKFTKVKIQYESSSTQKAKHNAGQSPNSNTRLKSNENGVIRINRKAYNDHPVKVYLGSKKSKTNENGNVLKENNRLKKPIVKDKYFNNNNEKTISSNLKRYGIVFVDPTANKNRDSKNIISLEELLPNIDCDILPSEQWSIDYFPNSDEPKDDKVYDRIAAELEDLMYNEKPVVKPDTKSDVTENKVDDFPSIMDILNDNVTENIQKPNYQSNSLEIKTNLESSDVEAMLLGKSNSTTSLETTPMDVDNTETSNIVEEVNQFGVEQEDSGVSQPEKQLSVGQEESVINEPETQLSVEQHAVNQPEKQLSIGEDAVNQSEKPDEIQEAKVTDEIDNPQSPSILDETLVKGIEEQLSAESQKVAEPTTVQNSNNDISTKIDVKIEENESTKVGSKNKENKLRTGITEVVFKKTRNGTCYKSVTCPKNLKYNIELEGKSVEFIGAPKYISSLEDLQVLLQIVNETELESLYVMH